MMTILGVAFGAAFVMMAVAALVQTIPSWRPASAAASRAVAILFLSIPLIFVAASGMNELGRIGVRHFVERRAPRLEEIRAAQGAYPPRYGTFFDDRLSYRTDGRSYTVTWRDRLVCGRGMAYHSATRSWQEWNSPCFF